jgi:hypothetical protein
MRFRHTDRVCFYYLGRTEHCTMQVTLKGEAMIVRSTSPFTRGALALAFAFSVFPMFCAAQQQRPQEVIPENVPPPPVYVNPRSGADDPRIGLKPGMRDAAEVASGMKRIASVAKPSVFDPPPPPPPAGATVTNSRQVGNGLTYANSDLAMGGNHLFVGNFYGISLYDIGDPAKIRLVTAIVCPGGQGDVSVFGNLLFMSVEGGGRINCGQEPFATPERPAAAAPGADPAAAAPGARAARNRPPQVAEPERIRGIRIFDISDITKPKQVAVVQTCRGSHTHTLVQDPKDKDNIYVYISGSAGVRPAAELAGCSGGEPGEDPDTALFTIVVIKVPLAHPELAKVVNSPRIFADPTTGAANGLFVSGVHGNTTAPPRATGGCHDITVYSAIGLAAGACSGNGILLDIKDPANPKRLMAESDPNFSFWHSATFANDGSKVLFTDEWGGGTQPRCRATDPMHWGADTIYGLKDGKLTLESYYKMPAAQTEEENCVAHNGSLIPVPGRDILVQGWYQGGVSIMDFTTGAHPYEIAYFDRGPLDATQHIIGGDWAAYWYNGYIYSSEIARGVDVFQLVPGKFLTQNEIDAANQIHYAELNPQNQQKTVWPQTALTAKAYLDQLARSNSLTADQVTAMGAALDKKKGKELKGFAATLEKKATSASPEDAKRMQDAASIMKKI